MGGCGMEQDEPGLYKWVILVAGFFTQFTASGIMYCVGVFYVMFKDNLQGSTSSIISLASSLNMCLTFGIGPVAGYLSQRYGYRRVAMVGSALATTGLILSALVTSAWQLCLTFGVLTGCGIGLSYIPSISAVSRYFSKHRAMAMGVAAAGLGTGPIVFPPLIQHFLHVYGWRGAMLMVSGLYLHSMLFACLLKPAAHSPYTLSNHTPDETIKDDSMETRGEIQITGQTDELIKQKHAGHPPDTGSRCSLFLLSSLYFHMFLLQCLLFSVGGSILYVHLGAYAISRGVSDDNAALLFLMLGITSTISRVLYGLLAQVRCIGPLRIYIMAQTLCGVCVTLYSFGHTYVMLSAGATSIGLFYGSFGSLPPLVTVLLVGPEHIATGYGYVCLACAVGYIAGGPFAGWLYDRTQYYPSSFFIGGGFMWASVLFLIPVCYLIQCKAGRPPNGDTISTIDDKDSVKA